MVLEGLAAVGAAAAVCQFIGYGVKVVSTTNELYKSTSGALEENDFLELVVTNLKTLLDRIKQSSTPTSQAVQSFRDDGIKLADEMLDGLEKLKVKGLPSKWKSLRKALKAVHSKAKIKSWDERLRTLRDRFNAHVQVDILNKLNGLEVSTLDGFQQLSAQQQQRLQAFVDAMRSKQDIFEQRMAQSLADLKVSNAAEHDVTRSRLDAKTGETQQTVKMEHEITRMTISKDQHDSLQQLSNENWNIKQHISLESEELRSVVESGQAWSLEQSARQHEQIRNIATDSIAKQAQSTQISLMKDNRSRLDHLEAEVFRTQLENEANLLKEHQRTRQTLEELLGRSRADAFTERLNSRAMLLRSLRPGDSQSTSKHRNMTHHGKEELLHTKAHCNSDTAFVEVIESGFRDLPAKIEDESVDPMARFLLKSHDLAMSYDDQDTWKALVAVDPLAMEMEKSFETGVKNHDQAMRERSTWSTVASGQRIDDDLSPVEHLNFYKPFESTSKPLPWSKNVGLNWCPKGCNCGANNAAEKRRLDDEALALATTRRKASYDSNTDSIEKPSNEGCHYPYAKELSFPNSESLVKDGYGTEVGHKEEVNNTAPNGFQFLNDDGIGTNKNSFRRFKCPRPGCTFACARMADLKRHLRNTHGPYALDDFSTQASWKDT